MAKLSVKGRWLEREREFFDQFDKDVIWYRKWARLNRQCQRVLALVLLVCSVLAPVTVASGKGTGLQVFGISEETVATLALFITLTLAFAEGIRRTFRFEQRYVTCVFVKEMLKRLRNEYNDDQIGEEIGSATWVANLSKIRNTYFDLTIKDVGEFAEIIKGEGAKPR